MLNPDFSLFDDNMFVQVRHLLADSAPHPGRELIDVTVGEPRIAPPHWLADELIKAASNWQAYPKAFADAHFLSCLEQYFANRFSAIAGGFSLAEHIVPVPGTREPLHFLGSCVRGAKPDSVALVSNPFYHAWRTGAMFAGGEIHYLPAFAENGFLPDLQQLDEALLRRTSILYLCSPSNPQGSIASAAYIAHAIELARHYDFLLVMDECYIDIWRNNKPVSALEVAFEMSPDAEDPFHHLVVLNSLSKRSSAAGLRVGFLCGDKRLISAYTKLVANGGALVPTPLLHVGGALYADEQHNAEIRAHYDTSFEILDAALAIDVPDGGFFLWHKVPPAFSRPNASSAASSDKAAEHHRTGDDLAFAKTLYEELGVKTVPGSLMASPTPHGNPGAGYVRLAIVHDHATISRLAERLAEMESR